MPVVLLFILLLAPAAAGGAYPLLCALPPALVVTFPLAPAGEQQASCDLVFLVVSLQVEVQLDMLFMRILVYCSLFSPCL